jgi:hypothetical protein
VRLVDPRLKVVRRPRSNYFLEAEQKVTRGHERALASIAPTIVVSPLLKPSRIIVSNLVAVRAEGTRPRPANRRNQSPVTVTGAKARRRADNH